MIGRGNPSRRFELATAISGLLVVAVPTAHAGGLALREQSATFQGSSFAGSAAGGALSSSFWNGAAFSEAGAGLSSDSSFTLIAPRAAVKSEDGTALPGAGGSPIGEEIYFDRMAVLSSSYYAYRINSNLVAGVAIGAPYGLGTELNDPYGAGSVHGRSGKVFTVNVNPTLAYNLTPNFALAVGLQAQYARIQFKSNPSSSPPSPQLPMQTSQGFDVDDVGFGGTAGILWTPTPGTTIGLGFRSAIQHSFEGNLFKVGDSLALGGPLTTGFQGVGLKADITLPEMVTLSLRQELTRTTRLLATIEWTNWSRLKTVDFKATSNGGAAPLPVIPGFLPAGYPGAPIAPDQVVSRFEFNWNDGWFFALGGEWDYSSRLTLRTGVAYEISPIQRADQRFTLITDSDRIWLSAGLTYKLTDSWTADLGVTHIFFEDAPIERATTTGGAARPFIGSAEQSVNIVSAGIRMKF